MNIKLIAYSALIASAMLIAPSCQSYTSYDLPQPDGGLQSQDIASDSQGSDRAIITFTAASGDASLSKTCYADVSKSGDICWQKTDNFSIFPAGKSENVPGYVSSINSSNASQCDISTEAGQSSGGYFALYPYIKDASYEGDKFSGIIIPETQHVKAGQYDPAADIMAAYATDEDRNLDFKHICAKLGIKIPADFDGTVQSIKLSCSEPIAGTVDVNLAAQPGAMPSAVLADGVRSVTLDCADGFEAGKTYYACILPTSGQSEIKITFIASDSQNSKRYMARIVAMCRATKNMADPSEAQPHAVGSIKVGDTDDLNLSGISSSATKIVFGYWDKVSLNGLVKEDPIDVAGIEHYSNGSEHYYIADDDICMPKNITGLFKDFSLLAELDLNNFHTDGVTLMGSLFCGCKQLKSLDLSNFNTASAMSLAALFKDCSSLESLNLSSFNTASVMTMLSMFHGCSSLKSIVVSEAFVVDKVTKSENMFFDCVNLVGGNETAYNSAYLDKTYARIDSDGAPGYFTKASQ